MCEHIKLPDGGSMIICGGRRSRHYCACGRLADLQCDWKVKTKSSGTCDAYICRQCALEVGVDKHLCKQHAIAYAEWKRSRSSSSPIAPTPQPTLFDQVEK